MTDSHYCPQCGIQRLGSLRYCRSCGFDYGASSEDSQGATATTAMHATPESPTNPPPSVPMPTAGRHWSPSNVGLIAAGAALVVAPFLPFITATAALVGSLSRNGVELVGVEAFALCLFGALIAATGIQRAGGASVGRALPLVSALAAAGLTGWYYSQVSERVSTAAADNVLASVGTGLWLAVGGSIVGVFIALRRPDAPWS